MVADIRYTLKSRGSVHGDFTDQASCAQDMLQVFARHCLKANQDMTPVQKESAHMIIHKLARIACGDPNHSDHWHDIAGYATLVEDRLSPPTGGQDV